MTKPEDLQIGDRVINNDAWTPNKPYYFVVIAIKIKRNAPFLIECEVCKSREWATRKQLRKIPKRKEG